MKNRLPSDFSPQKILVRVPNWLGDAIMATGVIKQLHALWPQAKIDLWGPSSIVSLFEEDPLVHKTWGWKAKGLIKYSPFHPLFAQLRREDYDLGVLLTNSFSSAWQMFWMDIKVRIGFSCEARGFLLTHAPQFPRLRATQHLVITYQELLKSISDRAKPLEVASPYLTVSLKELQEAKSWLKEHLASASTVVGLNPSAAYGPAKQWPKDRFQALARRLVAKGFGVIVFGDPSSRELGDYVCQGLESSGLCHNLSGKTSMKAFIALMASCQAVVANDSGPMHLAAALKVPLVAIFGSTDDKVTGPYGWGLVIHKRVECSPCFKRVCPIDFRCMLRIEVDEVEKALLEQLQSK